MANDPNVPNQAANKSKAEGERWKSDPDTVERHDRGSDEQMRRQESGGGVSNRPIGEEESSQDAVPPRGE